MSFEKRAGIVLAAYETLALSTGRVPPLTYYLRLHPLLGLAATAWVAHHLLWGARWTFTPSRPGSPSSPA
jgi:hypothetical protein